LKGAAPRDWRVALPGGTTVTAALDAPAKAGDAPVFICAHGAGGTMRSPAMTALGAALAARGVRVVRFNFPYSEADKGRPDPMPKLTTCFRAVIHDVKARLGPHHLVVGGRSMGGRAASMLLAEDARAADALLLFAYPLHPPGQPEKLRDAHLPALRVPVLCFNGTRDDFCTRALMDAVLARVPAQWEQRWVDDADHSFHVRAPADKAPGSTAASRDAAVLAKMADESARFVHGVTKPTRR
jgi:predicted alpha/beta-hydrolase family hydrolase